MIRSAALFGLWPRDTVLVKVEGETFVRVCRVMAKPWRDVNSQHICRGKAVAGHWFLSNGFMGALLERALCGHLEFTALSVVDRHHAFTNVVHPSVERKIAVDQPIRNTGMR